MTADKLAAPIEGAADAAKLTALLRDQFGLDGFRPGQAEVIGCLLAGRSAAAVFPTGGGKSLCYQLPSLCLPGLTLVISPLIALMKDQIDALRAKGVSAARLDSSLSADEYRDVMQQVRSGTLKLLYVAPERLSNERFRETIGQTPVSLMAVDEAHCISEWGHNFRPDYLKLAQFAKSARVERVLALTATATESVLRDIQKSFAIEDEAAIRTGFYRPNLTLMFTPALASERDRLLLSRLKTRPPGPTIVYVTLQKTAEAVARQLAAAGLSARAYHAGMKDDHRSDVQEWFMRSPDPLVVATIAFGMGIDKADIRYVYHYNLPKSLENYSQEIGRAGRDGEPSVCEVFSCASDVSVLENFARGDTPTAAAVRALIDELFSLGETFDASHFDLSARHDIRLMTVRTLLTYLEIEGFLESGTPFFSTYQFQPRMPSKQILSQFDGERRQFLAEILRRSTKAKTWFHLDVDKVAVDLQQPRERIVRAIDYLGEQQFLTLKTAGVRNSYRRVKPPADLDDLARRLHQRLQQREEREIARIRQVLDLVGLDGCQVASLGNHFGETSTENCGHCGWCLHGVAQAAADDPPPKIDDALWQRFEALRSEHKQLLADPHSSARFLCGLVSPGFTRARLTRNPLFGALEQVPFETVFARAHGE